MLNKKMSVCLYRSSLDNKPTYASYTIKLPKEMLMHRRGHRG